ncbi:MAG: hypothetical protein GY842_03445 [bacterium]|nr:hypothetical protein [bacterium]
MSAFLPPQVRFRRMNHNDLPASHRRAGCTSDRWPRAHRRDHAGPHPRRADVAVGDSALSQISNPASLALSRERRFDLSGQLLMPGLAWTSPVGHSHSRTIHPMTNMAVTFPVSERFSLGFALHCKSGLGSRYKTRHLLIPFMERHVASDMKNCSLSVSTACKVTEKLSVGAGLRAEVATAKFNSVLGPADVRFGRGYAYGGGFNLGLHYQTTDALAFGAAYRSPRPFGPIPLACDKSSSTCSATPSSSPRLAVCG